MSAIDRSKRLEHRVELLTRWTAVVGGAPPTALSTIRLERGIRYAEQIAADPSLKRLDRQVNRRLQQLARRTNPTKRTRRKKPMPGTRLLREWGGATHEVTVADQGYVYRGTTYRSLSGVAEFITGTRWSGPKFFGLT